MSAMTRFCFQLTPTWRAVFLQGVNPAVPELAHAASPEASSCCDCAPPPHQTMSFLMVSSFLKARSRSSG
jgi:hypothetical protein